MVFIVDPERLDFIPGLRFPAGQQFDGVLDAHKVVQVGIVEVGG